jgi:peptide/nickel transport system substrate-binding protein
MQKRVGRRRVLVATSATAAGAAILAACGGGSDSGGTKDTPKASGLLTPIEDESKNAIRGGTYKFINGISPLGFDPHTGEAASGTVVEPCYSLLWRLKEGYKDIPNGEIEGDLVESWEVSPDKTTITAKLTPNAHLSPQAPTNGRAVDAKDVVFSWERVRGTSNARGDLANSVNPAAPIVSITAPDDRTVVIKTAEANASLLALLSNNFQGYMIVAPKEGADPKVLDLGTTVRGSGPWYLSDLKPSVSYTFRRNPGFKHDKRDLPYMETVEVPVVPEYAAQLAQFRTGATYSMNARQEDVLALKKDVPELDLRPSGWLTTIPRPTFGLAPTSPFKDDRVRQAFVMTWDRDLFIDAFYNAAATRQAGVEVEGLWEVGLQANTWRGWVIDPKGKDFGPNVKYLKKDLAEAKKLMAAAGFTSAVEVDNNTPTGLGTQATFDRGVEIIVGFVEDGGLFKTNRKLSPFAPTFLANFNTAKGNFNGVAFFQSSLVQDPTNYLRAYYHPSGSRRQGTDDTFAELLDKAKGEFDDKKRQALLWDVQRREAEKSYFPRIAGATGLQVTWPALRNVGVYQGGTGRWNATLFVDPNRPPHKKA